ncbi:FxDxF family PEP-CTERM protein [Duganella radicis]|uniref:PEP-CTERM sorting domain-containing protein n=1 Tax=Duganella radicis TaxID=551988 RepID=A0A6L6PC12_9BURK|nr:FxDxF family PEP-CTERM protein [Duganella radicis]MTV36363.1 PEP-CTERM sorting domain-containing protein [Duganella radicis]
MKQAISAIALAAATFTCAHAASIDGLVNTGIGAAGTQDTHYALSVVSGNTVLPNDHAYISADNVWPVAKAWTANTDSSKWITPTSNVGAWLDPVVDGVYDYRLSFDLSGYDASTAAFTGRYAADNSVVVLLNGQQIASGHKFDTWLSFGASSGFVSGVNTLDFVVTNGHQTDNNPTGLRAEFLSSTVAAVPEPTTYAMLLAGLGLLAFAAKRRKA